MTSKQGCFYSNFKKIEVRFFKNSLVFLSNFLLTLINYILFTSSIVISSFPLSKLNEGQTCHLSY
jgi:hypothetical protein